MALEDVSGEAIGCNWPLAVLPIPLKRTTENQPHLADRPCDNGQKPLEQGALLRMGGGKSTGNILPQAEDLFSFSD
ncbi:MAG: hypothetical protein NZ602_10485 [Thermoguttaceae bacterium]|nr:hypothetical protein [Thermoguttaceae bacterium]